MYTRAVQGLGHFPEAGQKARKAASERGAVWPDTHKIHMRNWARPGGRPTCQKMISERGAAAVRPEAHIHFTKEPQEDSATCRRAVSHCQKMALHGRPSGVSFSRLGRPFHECYESVVDRDGGVPVVPQSSEAARSGLDALMPGK